MDLNTWISKNTEGSEIVVEFGAGFFDKLRAVHSSVKERIGIEAYEPYIAAAQYQDCTKIAGDMRLFKELVDPAKYDTALFVDSLEHISMEDAITLISEVKASFKKILLMIPEGVHNQTTDVTGYGGHTYQTHRSTWYEKDLQQLGFQTVEVDPKFHSGAGPEKAEGCLFAIWTRE